MVKKRTKLGILEIIRRELAKRQRDGDSLNQIALAAGVDTSQVTRLVSGSRDPGIQTAERLWEYLDLP